MKNLKSVTEALKSYATLTSKEQKQIKGGYYYSYEDCALECQAGSAGIPWDPGWGNAPVPAAGGCYEVRDGIWDCMDS